MEQELNPLSDETIPRRRTSQFQEENVQPVHKPLHHYRFTKQTLPGWRPVLSSLQAMLVLMSLCIALLIVGVVIFINENKYNEVKIRYDEECDITNDTTSDAQNACNLTLNVEKDIKGDLEIRYELTNFYQNQRRFGYSRVDEQLSGEYVGYSDMGKCDPYRSVDDKSDPSYWYLPCGLYAMSVFNDTFDVKAISPSFSEAGIAFKSEIDDIFKNLSTKYETGKKWLLENEIFKGQTNEHFMVWMRQSALPHIKKTYAKCSNCEVKAGKYTLSIWNRYPTDQFHGKKFFTVAKVNTLGSHNTYLGIVFMASGGVSGLYCLVLLIAELALPRKSGRYIGDEQTE